MITYKVFRGLFSCLDDVFQPFSGDFW